MKNLSRIIILTIAFLHISGLSFANDKTAQLNTYTFSQIPILEEGRIKPIGTYARTNLKAISGKEKWNEQSAELWLAEVLFNPAHAINEKVFCFKNTDLKSILRLKLGIDCFSITEIQPGLDASAKDVIAILDIDENKRTTDQKQLLTIHEKALTYMQLLRSFSMLLPLNISVPEKYETQANANTFLDLISIEQQVAEDVKTIIKRKGDNIEKYNNNEKTIALFGFQLQQIRTGGMGNDTFKIIPAQWNKNENWVAPWQVLENGEGSPVTMQFMNAWKDLSTAYRNNNKELWESASKDALNTATKYTQINKGRLKAELLYNSLKPYSWAMGLYALGILIITITLLKPNLKYSALATIITSLGLFAHLSGIAARIYILDRPPVGTLYESILFVSAISAFTSIIMTAKSKNPVLLLVGQITALGLLAFAPFLLKKDDSLELLVAVLNTDFWLTTHVLCITAGYGICILTGLAAHAYLFARAKGRSKQSLQQLYTMIYKTSLGALFLTAFGTVLGGIWADQSWGRFWGWDPKENGALLIVLWLIWALHSRVSGKMRDVPFAATMAALNIVVALSWFGVNLLGVGLHSYGFTSGLANGLALFCLTEIIIIGSLWTAIRQPWKKEKA